MTDIICQIHSSVQKIDEVFNTVLRDIIKCQEVTSK